MLDIQPVVKHSIPVCTEAKDLVELGKVQLAEVIALYVFVQFSVFSNLGF